jgi:hypothetical protein
VLWVEIGAGFRTEVAAADSAEVAADFAEVAADFAEVAAAGVAVADAADSRD